LFHRPVGVMSLVGLGPGGGVWLPRVLP
jgi:hypothetical protein